MLVVGFSNGIFDLFEVLPFDKAASYCRLHALYLHSLNQCTTWLLLHCLFLRMFDYINAMVSSVLDAEL